MRGKLRAVGLNELFGCLLACTTHRTLTTSKGAIQLVLPPPPEYYVAQRRHATNYRILHR